MKKTRILTVLLLAVMVSLLSACARQVEGVAYTRAEDGTIVFETGEWTWKPDGGYGIVARNGEEVLRATARQARLKVQEQEVVISIDGDGNPAAYSAPWGVTVGEDVAQTAEAALYYHRLGRIASDTFPWLAALVLLALAAGGVLLVLYAGNLVEKLPEKLGLQVRSLRIAGVALALLSIILLVLIIIA